MYRSRAESERGMRSRGRVLSDNAGTLQDCRRSSADVAGWDRRLGAAGRPKTRARQRGLQRGRGVAAYTVLSVSIVLARP